MKHIIFLLLFMLFVVGCTNIPADNSSNITANLNSSIKTDIDVRKYCEQDSDCISVVEAHPYCSHYCQGDECTLEIIQLCSAYNKGSKEYFKYVTCKMSSPCKEPVIIQCINNICVAS